MHNEKKIKITALVVTVFLLTSMGFLVHHVNVNEVLRKDLSTERLKGEKLLSEKLNVEKQIKSLKESMESLKGKNAELDKYLKAANTKIAERESSISRLNKDNAALSSYKKEVVALRKIQEELNDKLSLLAQNNSDLNAQLMDKDQMMVSLRKENMELLVKYNKLENEKLFADNFRIESLKKKNEKLTVKASKTKNVVVSFDIPEHLNGNVNEKSFRLELKKPVGIAVNGDQLVTIFDAQDNILTASTADYVAKDPKRATISFKPTEKLQNGIYTVTIYSGNELLGNAQIRLMK